jgi:hypothetical protein
MIASSYPLLDLFLTILYVFFFVIWLFLLVEILIDLFRSHDVSGWMKALWLVFILFFPLIGVLVYLIVRGGTMRRHQQEAAKAAQEEFTSYVLETSGTSTVDQLATLATLKERGALTEAEFEAQKAKLLSE